MESLPDDSYLKFHSDTLQSVRKMFNLDDPERMKDAIDHLVEWLKKQDHFTRIDFSREILERKLISAKGLVEKAKTRLDRYCTLKTMSSLLFDCNDVKSDEMQKMQTVINHTVTPRLTTDHTRVIVARINAEVPFTSNDTLMYLKYCMIMCEYLFKTDYANGYLLIVDVRNVNILDLVSKMNVSECRQAMTIFIEGYGARTKAMHYLTNSKVIDVFISLVKQFIPPKLIGRIYIHQNLNTLHEHVEKDVLPLEYGGQERPLLELSNEMNEVLGSEEHIKYLKEFTSSVGVNEAYRKTDKYINEHLGCGGAFRKLNVD